MLRMRRKFTITVAGSFYLAGALVLLIFPLNWLLAAAIAACFHDFCHYLSLRAFHTKILSVTIKISGIYIETELLSPGKEFICALAGPIGGGALILLSKWLPRTALCALVYSLYNLLPVYPLDGGRALRCGARILLPPKIAEIVCSFIEIIVAALLFIVGFYGTFLRHTGIFPILFTGILLMKIYKGKLSCKPRLQKVQ